VTTSTVEVVNGGRAAARKPAPIPTLLEGATDPRELALSNAIPADANLDTAAYVLQQPRQLVVTWNRVHYTRDRSAAVWERHGVGIWQLESVDTATWHRVYTEETRLTNTRGVEAYGVTLGDASGDNRPEVLIFASVDGSAGAGTYYLLANVGRRVRRVFTQSLSEDEGTMSFAHRALVVLEGVDFRGPGVHCCFRKVRETWLRWNGRRMVVLRRVVRRNRREWPPG
jgi:hypothetical protein